MYTTLNDCPLFPVGDDTQIWYVRGEHLRDFNFGYDNFKIAKARGTYPDYKNLKESVARTHIMIGATANRNLNKLYSDLQGERWSPQGEARDLIRSLGLKHMSMSVGDILAVRHGEIRTWWIVANVGFACLGTTVALF